MKSLAIAALALVASNFWITPALGNEPGRIFLLHNSVGRLLIEQGEMREYLDEYNTQHQTDLRFWDHNYPYIGVADAEGELLGYPYSSVCGHNTAPSGLHLLWLNQSIPQYANARDSIMTMHDVIAFKSCYRATDFDGAETENELDAALAQYKSWYLEMRDFFDQHPDKTFIALSIPPRHRLHPEASPARAARSRQFANWLQSSEFLGNPPRPNVHTFDILDLLAEPDDGQPNANMLRHDYERSHNGPDSHPNELANSIVGPLLMQFLIDVSQPTPTSVDQVPSSLQVDLQIFPNPFNPYTTLSFELPQAMPITLEILDLRGQRVHLLESGILGSGLHRYTWNGRGPEGRPVSSGVFIGRLQAGNQETVQILTLVK